VQRRAVVVLAGSGRIGWATPQSRQVLHDWFGYSGGLELPAGLADWVHAGCDRASRSAFEFAPSASPAMAWTDAHTVTVKDHQLRPPHADPRYPDPSSGGCRSSKPRTAPRPERKLKEAAEPSPGNIAVIVRK
jgi:hypothetical protein